MKSRTNKVKFSVSNDTKRIVIVISVFFILFLILFFYFKNQNQNYSSIKEDKNQFLIYTKYEKSKGSFSVTIPYVNIRSNSIKLVNEDIDLFVNDFMKDDKAIISYEYDINGIILSLVVKVVDYDTNYAPQPYFRSYNINLDTLEVISNESLLHYFGIDENTVEKTIESQFYYYYQEILKEDYYQEDECNFSCFLKFRGIEKYLDSVSYYVKKGSLIAYRPFIFTSIYGEEDFFLDKHFEFLIVKSKEE